MPRTIGGEAYPSLKVCAPLKTAVL